MLLFLEDWVEAENPMYMGSKKISERFLFNEKSGTSGFDTLNGAKTGIFDRVKLHCEDIVCGISIVGVMGTFAWKLA
ncbi:hypothetical protein C5167_000696 [Papaver somniferum]|uniref:Uncharacterized protein n=1 Tax=Papaver somniferum TaxID=3469 RepID=A0A4Y7KUZ7_PAPSO|nr:hypothetical protein C5167_000696 [Papaver somniferum]